MKGIKNILLGLLLLVSTISLSQGFTMGNRVLMSGATIPSEITLTSTSTLSSWFVGSTTNPGPTLEWTVSGGVTIAKTTTNNPNFNFSSNTGTANILIEKAQNLTNIQFQALDLTSINITGPSSLITFDFNSNIVTSVNIDVCTSLVTLRALFNLLTSIDISNNVLLTTLEIQLNNLTTFDLSANVLLLNVNVRNNSLPSGVLDQIYIDLDTNGLSNGTLTIDAGRTAASDTARANLITKNWTITEI